MLQQSSRRRLNGGEDLIHSKGKIKIKGIKEGENWQRGGDSKMQKFKVRVEARCYRREEGPRQKRKCQVKAGGSEER